MSLQPGDAMPKIFRLPLLGLLLGTLSGLGAPLVWDADPLPSGAQDGPGIWSVGAGHFFDPGTPADNQLWTDGQDAVFGAGTNTAGVVTIQGGVAVNTLLFAPTGGGTYRLQGDALRVESGSIHVQANAAVSAPLSLGSDLSVGGTATLTLDAAGPIALGGAVSVGGAHLHLQHGVGPALPPTALSLSGGGRLTLGGPGQLPVGLALYVEGAGSCFNGTAVNVGQLVNTSATFSRVIQAGGGFNTGLGGTWIVDGHSAFTGGAGQTVFLGNSGSRYETQSLAVTNLNAVAGGTVATLNSFTLYGLTTGDPTTLRVGAGGLALQNSVLNLRRGNLAAHTGSRLLLEGDIVATGTSGSTLQEDTAGGTFGSRDLIWSETTGVVTRVAHAAGGGANLTLALPIRRGAAASLHLRKTGSGSLTLGGPVDNEIDDTLVVEEGTLVLNKTGGALAFRGDLELQAGGLTWSGSHQVPDEATLTVRGGTINPMSRMETFTDYVQHGGGFTGSGNTGQVTLLGTLRLLGGNNLTLNSNGGSATPAAWAMHRAELLGAGLVLGGNNGAGNPRTTFTIGPGGLAMAGRTITLNRGDAGTLLQLHGHFSGSGTNHITPATTAAVEPEIDLGGEVRRFEVSGGETTVSVQMTGNGAGLRKEGAGTLVLGALNTFDGPTTVAQGALRWNLPAALYAADPGKWDTSLLRVEAGAMAIFRVGGATEFAEADIYHLAGLADATGGFQPDAILGLDTSAGLATQSLPLADGNGGTHRLHLAKLGANTLVLAGNDPNTHTGLTTVHAGAIRLSKTAGVDALGGHLELRPGALVTFTANHQLPDHAVITLSGPGSVFNGSGVNTGHLNTIVETAAAIRATGGAFNAGTACDWDFTGASSFTGGAGNTIVVGNSGALLRFGGLALTNLTAVAGGTVPTPNTFTLYGNSTTRRSTLRVGPLGLRLDNARLNLRRGGTGALGSRLVLGGEVTTAGDQPSFLTEDTVGGVTGAIGIELGDSPDPVLRAFHVPSGGADLIIDVPLVNGQASTAGLRKTGAGTLRLSGGNLYNGATEVLGGVLHLDQPGLADAGRLTVASGARVHLAFASTDSVESLVLSGLGRAAGTYGATGSGAQFIDDTHFSGPGQILVANTLTGSPFAQWAADRGLDGSPGREAGPTDNPDQDAHDNFTEFALDGDPRSPADPALWEARVVDANANALEDFVLSARLRAGAVFLPAGDGWAAENDGVRYILHGFLALPGPGQVLHEVLPALPGPAASAGYERRSFRLVPADGTPGPGYIRLTVGAP
jgi:autotransporter-associated beta strand protein